ncbi:MAG: hypothetical protein HY053_03655 [Proteobacteria bacterium]|nr:hypothetical protein [Pseudomonadota bacterium]
MRTAPSSGKLEKAIPVIVFLALAAGTGAALRWQANIVNAFGEGIADILLARGEGKIDPAQSYMGFKFSAKTFAGTNGERCAYMETEDGRPLNRPRSRCEAAKAEPSS